MPSQAQAATPTTGSPNEVFGREGLELAILGMLFIACIALGVGFVLFMSTAGS